MPYSEIPTLLSLSDALVQPGAENAFNEFRLPGKLPEFFAMGRPVILPRTNVGRFVRPGDDALVLDKVDALGIVEAVRELHRNKSLSERLSAGALQFAEKHFDWNKNARTLAEFYETIATRQPEEANAGAALE